VTYHQPLGCDIDETLRVAELAQPPLELVAELRLAERAEPVLALELDRARQRVLEDLGETVRRDPLLGLTSSTGG
jgi:hypothetical protein